MKKTPNGFDAISDLIDRNGSPENSNLASVDIGANSFFEIGLPLNNPENNQNQEDREELTIDNDLLGDLIPEEKETPQKKEKPKVTKKTEADTEEEDDEDQTEEIIDLKDVLSDDEDYDTWSDYSLIALRQVKNGKWDLDEKEIPKDLDAITLMEMYDTQENITVEKIKKDMYAEAGEAANYIKFLIDGGSPEVVQHGLELDKIISLDSSEEDNQKDILRAYFEIKEMDEDIIESSIESILDKGKGKQKADEALDQLSKYKNSILEAKTKEIEDAKIARKQQYDSYVNDVTKVVRSGKIGGVVVDKTKQDQILNAMFKPTERVEITNPRTGVKEKKFVTKSTLLFQDANSSPEKLAAMTLWLLHGGDFEGIKESVKVEKDDSLRDLLKGRRTKTVINTRNTKPNGFEVLANSAQNQNQQIYYNS